MTREEITAALIVWRDHCLAVDAAYEADRAACGANVESPRWDAVYRMLDAYTDSVGTVIDASDWLSWWRYENGMGKRGLQAGYDGDIKEIRGLESLVDLVMEENRRRAMPSEMVA